MSRRSLFYKYVGLFAAVVSFALVTSGFAQIFFWYRDYRNVLDRIQDQEAQAAASRVSSFIREIETQLGWVISSPLSANLPEQMRFDARRVLRQVPAITELSRIDAHGREQIRVSRIAMDVVGGGADFSAVPKFTEAVAGRIYRGPVYFRRETEPYITMSVGGMRPDTGVVAAEVNLRLIWDIVSTIRIGERGYCYIVDAQGRLIAHPDISLVLRNTNLAQLPQVRSALDRELTEQGSVQESHDVEGRPVLATSVPIVPPGWRLLAELPVDEARAPLIDSLLRSVLLLLVGLALALAAGVFLARRMTIPIRALEAGAARIGSGDLSQRIAISTGDELQALGDRFNTMAERLQESYTSLERKVEERTRQLEAAIIAKSRFLAAATHDLRQPLHALGLFAAQLHVEHTAASREHLAERINASVLDLNELFNALLDISKLDAGVLRPDVRLFSISAILNRIESTFLPAALQKHLSLRVIASSAWVSSDLILLERILLNLVSNAIRYTDCGGVIVGCRRRGTMLRIEVWDSGKGIPPEERTNIFAEFYRISAGRDHPAGLGLGLAIVDRLCRLLQHPLTLDSIVGAGSRFTLTVPLAEAQPQAAASANDGQPASFSPGAQLIVVIDDDPLAREGLATLLRTWGFRVVSADSDQAALAALAEIGSRPTLIIADYQLKDGRTGIEAIEQMHDRCRERIPAFLISGDTAPDVLREVQASGYHMLYKPVTPMALRASFVRFLKRDDGVPLWRETGRTPQDRGSVKLI